MVFREVSRPATMMVRGRDWPVIEMASTERRTAPYPRHSKAKANSWLVVALGTFSRTTQDGRLLAIAARKYPARSGFLDFPTDARECAGQGSPPAAMNPRSKQPAPVKKDPTVKAFRLESPMATIVQAFVYVLRRASHSFPSQASYSVYLPPFLICPPGSCNLVR